MKLSTSTTAAILAVVASVQGAAAVDFDFREFEVRLRNVHVFLQPLYLYRQMQQQPNENMLVILT